MRFVRRRYLGACLVALLVVLQGYTSQPQAFYSNGFTDQEEEGSFTIVFFSDMEMNYRDHSPERCRYVLRYICDLKEKRLYFDSGPKISPKLILHGGDLIHNLGCEIGWRCWTVLELWHALWKIPFQKRIPLLSNAGNHDWQSKPTTGNTSYQMWSSSRTNKRPHGLRTDFINGQSHRLIRKTYETSTKLGVTYQEFRPTGQIGPSMYRAEFRGVQIASFNVAANWESYDSPLFGRTNRIYSSDTVLEQLDKSLNRSMTTLFTEHFPVPDLPAATQEWVTRLMDQFNRSALFTGHLHVAVNDSNRYIAPYPHAWKGRRGEFQPPLPASVYAILVHPHNGILEVKQVAIPSLPEGVVCRPETVYDSFLARSSLAPCGKCGLGHSFWYADNAYKCGREPRLSVGATCEYFGSCRSCANKRRRTCRLGFFGCKCG